MSLRSIKGNLLFWKIAAVFTTLLMLLGLAFMLIASRFSQSYYTAAHQALFGNLAQHLSSFTRPIRNGRPDTSVIHDILHSTMVANPSVEIYLLDTAGNITDYVVPDTSVKVHRVDISKIKQWLSATTCEHPLGDNPKQPIVPSIFSVAPVFERSQLAGYVYVVLASEKQREILGNLQTNWYRRLGSYILLTAFIAALVVGLITFFLITDSICSIAQVVKRFKEGDYSARIGGFAKGNLGVLTSTFNEMADVIVENIARISATDKFRQELIANISHDIRTPLSIMQGYVETLIIKKGTLGDVEKDKYLMVVHDSARKLSALVDQLFEFARLEANVIMPEKEPFALSDLISDILMAYQLRAAERNITLLLEARTNLPRVFADVALTERVFHNLLDNALRHTPDGGSITIRLSESNTGIEVQVADTGSGIPANEQPFLFQRYKQIRPATPQKGMGIGLSIAKKILELHQTSIEVSSEFGKGTVFQFVLPITR